MNLNFRAEEGEVGKDVTFDGYKISADAKLLEGKTWIGSYLVEKDGRVIRTGPSVTWRSTKASAEAGALIFGIQFVDNCLARKQRVGEARPAGNDRHIGVMTERSSRK